MTRRQFRLTARQAEELLRATERCQDRLTRSRYRAVRLYGLGHPVSEIETLTGCSRSSLMEWCRWYREGGLPGLADKRAGGNRAKLTGEEKREVDERLHRLTPADLFEAPAHPENLWTTRDLRRAVKRWYGVEYAGCSSYYRLFAQSGFGYDPDVRAFVAPAPTGQRQSYRRQRT
jgi:transposase